MTTLHQLVRPSVVRACARCGYGVGPRRASTRCPICGGTAWRPLLPAR